MKIKKAGGKVFGAVLTAAEKKAMEMEINRQIVETDRRYADDIDAMVLYTLHVHLGLGKKRLREFYEDVYKRQVRNPLQNPPRYWQSRQDCWTPHKMCRRQRQSPDD